MKRILVAAAMALSLAGCGGGGGNGDGAPGYTHDQLAQQFVNALNATGSYSVTLAKDSTNQYNYIVVYDKDLNEYDAINIGGYTPGMDVVAYLNSSAAAIYFNLGTVPGYYDYTYSTDYDYTCDCYVTTQYETWIPTQYQDWVTGILFEKVQGSTKDLEKFGALAQEKVINSRAEGVSSKFGLSVERSKEVVRLAMAWRRAGGKDLTDKDQDSFSKEMLGFSITEAKAAAKQKAAGNDAPLDSLVDTAAATNSTSPENVRQIINTYINQK